MGKRPSFIILLQEVVPMGSRLPRHQAFQEGMRDGIPIALGRSALTVFSRESSAEIACRNIARRLTGERVPLMKLPRR